MNESDRALLRELRTALLHLHKTLLDWQRAEYELDHGAMAPAQLLQIIFDDAAFAWLRPMSGLIVAIDEALAAKPPESPSAAPLIAQARELAAPAAGTRSACLPRRPASGKQSTSCDNKKCCADDLIHELILLFLSYADSILSRL